MANGTLVTWETRAGVWAEYDMVLEGMADEIPWLALSPVVVDWGLSIEGTEIPWDSPIIQTVFAASQKVSDEPAWPSVLKAGCDVWIYSRIAGTPTVLYGPGEIALGLGPDESVSLDDLKKATRTMAALILDWSR